MKFLCRTCGKEYDFGELRWKCDCGGYIVLKDKFKFTKKDIKSERLNMWRYDAAYPLKKDEALISYNEGLTPLARLNHENYNIRLKLEYLMPTGSFKDRGTVMVINYLNNYNAGFFTEDSSGNAAASVAGYCALGGLKCALYVPHGNSSGKILQAKAYGADINEIKGSRSDVAYAAQKFDKAYAGHNWHPLFTEGTKSIAYELWEQNNFKEPENIIVPCGAGSLVLGLIKGFTELLESGEIKKLPKIFAVQPANCNPVYRMFKGINEDFIPEPTIAEGTSISEPVKAAEISEGIKLSEGAVLSVKEEEIKEALKFILKKGYYIEPTSAAAVAGALQLMEKGILKESDEIIIVISGNGLKSGERIQEILNN